MGFDRSVHVIRDLSDGDKFAVHSLCVIGGKTNNDNGITDKGLHRFARKGRARTVDSLGIVGAEIGDRFGKNFDFDFASQNELAQTIDFVLRNGFRHKHSEAVRDSDD